MQSSFRDGSVMVAGICSEPKYARVGQKGTRRCSVSIRVGLSGEQDENGRDTGRWAYVVAWNDLADVLATAGRGCSVCAIGRLREHEYEGKTLRDVNAEWLSVARIPSGGDAGYESPAPLPPVEELDDEDGELPF